MLKTFAVAASRCIAAFRESGGRDALKSASFFPGSVIVYDPRFLDHVPSPFHVERPDRLRSIVDRLRREGLFHDVQTPVPASEDDLRRVHRESYVDLVRTLEEGFLDPETAVHKDTFGIATLAAGAVIQATRVAVRDGRPAVALVRPPGHHAGPDYGGGFCYLNNVAVAASDQVAGGRRVAILDYDAHHGNGTRDIFAADSSVLYVSTHQYGIYPGTGPAEDVGDGEGRGFTVNIPFPAGCGDASYRAALAAIIEPIVTQFRPDVVLVSLGIDAHYRDPLTSLSLSSPAYVEVLSRSAEWAARLCGSRFVIALEGGYHLEALGEVFAGVVAHLEGRTVPLTLTEVLDDKGRGLMAIEATKQAQREYWNLR
jgi:acetoin utilization deacetylase AcuC-like enzyme